MRMLDQILTQLISIHALHEESDPAPQGNVFQRHSNFNPRSP